MAWACQLKLCCAHGWCLAGTSPLCWHARVRASQAVQPTLSMRLSQDVERNYSRGRRKRYYCLPRPKASMLTSMRQLQAPRAKSYLEKAAYRRPQGLCAVRHRRSLGIDAARPSNSCEAHASAWPAGGVRGRPIWSSSCNPNPVRVRVRAALVASDSPCHYLSDAAMWGPKIRTPRKCQWQLGEWPAACHVCTGCVWTGRNCI